MDRQRRCSGQIIRHEMDAPCHARSAARRDGKRPTMSDQRGQARTAAATGAGSGLGREVALQLAAKGYRVFGTGLVEDELDDLSAASNGRVSLSLHDIPTTTPSRPGYARLLARWTKPASTYSSHRHPHTGATPVWRSPRFFHRHTGRRHEGNHDGRADELLHSASSRNTSPCQSFSVLVEPSEPAHPPLQHARSTR